MSRKPIEENVKRRLFAESMGRCMNPNCRKELFESCGDIIEKAHIQSPVVFDHASRLQAHLLFQYGKEWNESVVFAISHGTFGYFGHA